MTQENTGGQGMSDDVIAKRLRDIIDGDEYHRPEAPDGYAIVRRHSVNDDERDRVEDWLARHGGRVLRQGSDDLPAELEPFEATMNVEDERYYLVPTGPLP